MTIETTRLRLRLFEILDAEWLFSVTRNDEVHKYLLGAYNHSLDQAVDCIINYYSKGDCIHDFYFVIENKETHEYIGFLIITQNFEGEFEVAMFTSKEYWRRGYMIEALWAFVQQIPKYSTLKFVVNRQNEVSLKTLQKLNVTEITGTVSERIFILEI